jgi:hypothetical protein
MLFILTYRGFHTSLLEYSFELLVKFVVRGSLVTCLERLELGSLIKLIKLISQV